MPLCQHLIRIWLCWPGLLLSTLPGLAQAWQATFDSAAAEVRLLRYHTARPLAARALTLAAAQFGTADTNYAHTLTLLAEAENRTDQFDAALQHAQESLGIWERVAGKQTAPYATTLQVVAECQQNLIVYATAEANHTEALRLTGEQSGKASRSYGVALHRMGVFYQIMGLTSKALSYVAQAKALLATDSLGLPYALLLKTEGELYTYCRRERINPNQAIACFQTSLRLVERQAGRQNTTYAELLRNLSVAYPYQRRFLNQQSPDEALLLREATDILHQTIGPESAGYAACAEALADLYRRRGEYDKARPLLEQVQRFSLSFYGPSDPYYTNILFYLARLYTQMGLYRQAEPLLLQSNLNLIRELRLFSVTLNDEEREQLVFNAANGFVWLHSYARLFGAHNPAITGEQYDTQLAVKAFLLRADQKFRQRLFTHADTVTRHLYTDWQKSRQTLAQVARMPRSEQLRRGVRMDSLERAANGLEKQLVRRVQAGSGSLAGTSAATWRDVQRQLRPGEAAVELVRYVRYNVTDRRWHPTDTVHYAALIVTPTSAYPAVVYLENGNALEGPLLAAHQRDILHQTQATDSYRHYWQPIAGALRGVRRVYLSPDGVYCQLNLNGLRNPATGRYVLDEHELVQLTSTADLLRTQPVAPGRRPSALLVGYPDYGPAPAPSAPAVALRQASRTRLSRDGYYDPLPGTRQEVNEVSSLLRARFAVRTYTQAEAREEVVKTAESPTLLHMATHGFFETDTALGRSLQSPLFRSGLVLAGANRALHDTATGDLFAANRPEDGILTAYEAMNLQLDQTELVVLSACQTGLGEVRNGEGVYGLQRAFHVAGARALLMSLWKVDDDVTRRLMTAFYRHWLASGDKVRAFRLAQQTIRARYPQPFFWGAFVLVGR